MISERMDHPPFGDEAKGTAIEKSVASDSHTRKLPIDTLPIELLEWAICIAATNFAGPSISWVCLWRRVSRRWASVIDYCPALWSYIEVLNDTRRVPIQLAKSKGVPLTIELLSISLSQDVEWIRLLVDNVHRWKSITFGSHLKQVSAMLDSPPPLLEALEIHEIEIPPDSKFFNPSSPNLRALKLSQLAIPSNIQPVFGLEELRLYRIHEAFGYRTVSPISVRKLHQFLQASPGLQVLEFTGNCTASAADKSLQQVNLPNLQKLKVYDFPVLHLFRAEHCADLSVSLYSVKKKLSRGTWMTVVPMLRRAKGLEVEVSKYRLRIVSLAEPPTIELEIGIESRKEDVDDLSYAILEEILQELENESCISARIQLSFFAYSEEIGVKVLKLLQSPMPGPSARWRLPYLDTVCIHGKGFPYQSLKAFVQARANAQGGQAPNAVTSILESEPLRYKQILGEVMDYAGDERDLHGAVVQAG